MRWLPLLTAFSLCGVLLGDVIHLADGRKIEGKVVKETDDEVWVEKRGGVRLKISKERIVGIEKKETEWEDLEEEYRRRYEAAKGDAEKLFELARWAQKKGMLRQARELLEEVLRLAPQHEGARKALGYSPKKAPKPSKRSQHASASRRRPRSLSHARKRELKELIKRYFAQPEEREKVLERLKQIDEIPLREVKRLAQFAFKCAKQFGPKVKQGESYFEHPKYRGLIYVRVFGRAGPKSKLPLFVALHGGGKGRGHYSGAVRTWLGRVRRRLRNFIFVAPTVLHKRYAEWGGYPEEEAYVKEVIKAVKRTYNVDTNRVYLAGFSMGGYGTWHIGGHEADVFAGLAAGAGGILILPHLGEPWGKGIIANLMHTPIAFAHGSNDRPAPVWSDRKANEILNQLAQKYPGCYKHLYIEVPGGHQAPIPKLNQLVDWIFKFKRNPYPKHVIWEPKRKFNHYLWWLKVKNPKIGQRLEAKIEGNTITIETRNIDKGFSVLLNEKLIDPHKKVRVVLNGKEVFNDYITARVSAIIESIDEKIDEEMWFWARIDF